ncbi:HNH endonuclease [Enterobacter cloacae]|nr:HNH endonuclease [Enterobacter cloacae]
MHVDHIKPRSKFPHLALEITRFRVLCEDCNKAKSNADDIKWRQ